MLSTIDVQSTSSAKCPIEKFTDILDNISDQPNWREQANKECDYCDGNQLDSEILQAQKAKGIPNSIENLIGRTVKDIRGMEAKNRTDWKVSPENTDGEGEDVAEALNVKLNEAEKRSGADKACTLGFAGQVKVGLTWVEVDREQDPFKYKYRVREVHRNEIWWDMRAKELDLSDAMWLLRRRWTNINVAVNLFPKHKKLIKHVGSGWSTFDSSLALEDDESTGLFQSQEIERGWTIEEQEWRDGDDEERVCLFEVLTRHPRQAMVLTMPDGRVIEFDKANPLHIRAVEVGIELKSAMVSDIYKTFYLGCHFLCETKLDLPYGKWNYIPFWGEKEDRTGIPYGVIRDLMYLQDEVNARISKIQWGLSAVRTVRTEDAVAMDDEVLRQTIGRPDADIILNKQEMQNGGIFKVEKDFELNAQQYQRLQDLRESVKSISGVSDAMSGQGGADSFSGLQLQVEQTVQSMSIIVDNFEYARSLVGDLLLSMIIQDTDEEEDVHLKAGLTKESRVVTLNKQVQDECGITYLDNDVQKTRLLVSLEEVPSTSSYREQQLSAISEAFKSAPEKYQTIMLPHMVSLMSIPDKDEIVEAIKQANDQVSPEQIEEMVADGVEQEKLKMQYDLKVRELELKEKKGEADIEKTVNEAVKTSIEALYTSIQTAGVIAQTPQVAPLADDIAKSSGFIDKNISPIFPVPDAPIVNESMIPENAPPLPETENNNPTTPVPPSSPNIGAANGIETQNIEQLGSPAQ